MRNACALYRALGHEARLDMVKFMVERGTACPEDFMRALHLSQSLVSQHAAKLVRAGVLKESKEGIRRRYTLDPDRLWKAAINPRQLVETR